MRNILLNPGPVSLSEGVRHAAAATDLCHRESEYFDLQDRVRSKLTDIYKLDSAQWTAVLLGGSGTTALEAMISSLVPRTGKLLVLENGVYGERLSRVAEIHDISYERITHNWIDSWDIQRVRAALSAGDYTHVAAVHHETTTGRLNSISELLEVCSQHNLELLLDTVSSFGAEPIPFDAPALLACAGTANKCLHGIPGLSFVMVRTGNLATAVVPPRSLTLDLSHWADHQARRSTPFTPSVNSILALDVALNELELSGGWIVRQARYHHLASQVAKCLIAHGVEALLPETESSCVLRAYRLGGNREYADIHDRLKQRGFVVYAGQGSIGKEIFRISTMGNICDSDMERLLISLDAVFS